MANVAATADAKKPQGKGVVGKVEMRKLSDVKPNPWNPNVMTVFEKESLKTGLVQDGWLAAQALLVWGSDDKGKERNVIIDGEHRWTAAGELNFEKGPMVLLHGITEAQAKALTIKMNAKRGKFQEDRLAELVRTIQLELDVPDLSLDLGIDQEHMMKMLAVEPENLDALAKNAEGAPPVTAPPTEQAKMQQGHVQLVQLFFSKEQHAAFTAISRKLAEKAKTKNISDTVLAALNYWESKEGAIVAEIPLGDLTKEA